MALTGRFIGSQPIDRSAAAPKDEVVVSFQLSVLSFGLVREKVADN
jgi:hypothetical protein